jgi:hypothetical protein
MLLSGRELAWVFKKNPKQKNPPKIYQDITIKCVTLSSLGVYEQEVDLQ